MERPAIMHHFVKTEQAAMRALISQGSRELHGLEIVTQSGHALKRSTVYLTLNRLENLGYLTSRMQSIEDANRIPKRLYKVTGEGARQFAAWEIGMQAQKQALGLGRSLFAGDLV